MHVKLVRKVDFVRGVYGVKLQKKCKGCPEKVFLLCLQGITGCLKKYCEIEINTRLKIVREFNAQTKKNFVLVISGLKGGQNIYVFFKTQKGSRG